MNVLNKGADLEDLQVRFLVKRHLRPMLQSPSEQGCDAPGIITVKTWQNFLGNMLKAALSSDRGFLTSFMSA